jgi:hypothetical protein
MGSDPLIKNNPRKLRLKEAALSLKTDEQYWLAWYRNLNTVQRLAVRCYINTGDIRLFLWVRRSVVLWQVLVDKAQQGSQISGS